MQSFPLVHDGCVAFELDLVLPDAIGTKDDRQRQHSADQSAAVAVFKPFAKLEPQQQR